jgi:hypothetical protein
MGVLPIGIHGQDQAAILRERALRLVPEAPIHETTTNHTRPRLKARNGKYHLRVQVPVTQGPAVVVHRCGLPARCRTEWPGDPTNHCASCRNPRRKQTCLRRLSLPDLVTPPLGINQQPLVMTHSSTLCYGVAIQSGPSFRVIPLPATEEGLPSYWTSLLPYLSSLRRYLPGRRPHHHPLPSLCRGTCQSPTREGHLLSSSLPGQGGWLLI